MLRSTKLLSAVLLLLATTRTSSAALLFYTDPALYQAQLTALSLVTAQTANFDAQPQGSVGANYIENGISFSSGNPMAVWSGTTSSAPNFLGYNDMVFQEFTNMDVVTITLPANARAMSLRAITETIPDFLAYARLNTGAQFVDTVPGGTPLVGSFQSYFLGVVDDANTISNATFEIFGGATFYRIDDVSYAVGGSVPEPNSLLLIGVGLMGTILRRRKRA